MPRYWFLSFFHFWDRVSLCCPGWNTGPPSWLTATSASWVQAILPASASWITGTCYHAWLIYVFLVETGFHHVSQTGLKYVTSGDPPTLASQSAGITGVSHCSWTVYLFFIFIVFFLILNGCLNSSFSPETQCCCECLFVHIHRLLLEQWLLTTTYSKKCILNPVWYSPICT